MAWLLWWRECPNNAANPAPRQISGRQKARGLSSIARICVSPLNDDGDIEVLLNALRALRR
jgi:selenocysteine lyase/cysteine desulfurase